MAYRWGCRCCPGLHDEDTLYKCGRRAGTGRLYRPTQLVGQEVQMSQFVTGRSGDWEVVIGMEVHAHK